MLKHDVTQCQGEITLLVEGAAEVSLAASEADVLAELEALMACGMSASDAARVAAERCHVSRGVAYDLSLEVASRTKQP